jgi:glycosyltransferase involved in cell wall biosynthesis
VSGEDPAEGLRIALLSPCYWPEVRRGSERFINELAGGLITRGHRPRLITSHRGRPSTTVKDGLPIVRNWRPPQGRLQRRNFEDYLTHMPFSYLSLARGDDQLAHAVYPTDALAAVRWAERTGRPAILSYMGIPDRRGLAYRRLRIETTLRAVDGCDAVVALSRTAAESFRRWLGVDALVIHPGVDLEAFQPGPGRAEEPTIFCGAALEEERKRVGLLIEAFRIVRRRRPGARLLLSRPRDPVVAERFGARESGIELIDVDERPALAEAYRRTWVSALPSFGEAFGLVLVEALACGTPVVGSNLDGIPEVIDGPAIGRLFDGADPETLAGALLETLELARDPATPGACRARAEEFSVDRCVESYEALYRRLIAERS